MSKRLDLRYLWIDLCLLLAMLLLGWAVFRLATTEPTISRDGQQSQDLRNVFEECQKLVREGMGNPERIRRKSDLEWQETMLLQDEYLNIGQRIQAELPALEKALDEVTQPKIALQ